MARYSIEPVIPGGPEKESILDRLGTSPHINWYPGHMVKAMQHLSTLLQRCDCVIEVRDARIPFTSANPLLDQLIIKRKKIRLVVLNKVDLISLQDAKTVVSVLREEGVIVIPLEAKSKDSAKVLLNLIKKHINPKFKSIPALVAVVGFPNVGKSTIINALRQISIVSGHMEGLSNVAAVGARPGITRHISGFFVSKQPPIIIQDTPGIMVPGQHTGGNRAELGVRLALTEMLHDHMAQPTILAGYLFLFMQDRKYTKFLSICGIGQDPISDPEDLFARLKEKVGAPKTKYIKKISSSNAWKHGSSAKVAVNDDSYREKAALFFLRKYRAGEFGRFMLDSVAEYQKYAADREALKRGLLDPTLPSNQTHTGPANTSVDTPPTAPAHNANANYSQP